MSPDAARIIVALDTPDPDQALEWADSLRGEVGVVKVGLELFTRAGPALVRELRAREHRVFLDLKLHDIPHTVRRSVVSIASLDVQMTTLHAAGGSAMLRAATEARNQADSSLQLLAVTVLTSLDDDALEEIGLRGPASRRVPALASLAAACGVDGAVCSPLEAAAVRRAAGAGFLLVTPGVRPAGASHDDQARASTPAAAVRNGADYIVVGRPITRADDPCAAARRIAAELAG